MSVLMNTSKKLLLVPDLRGGGGVTNLYNVLRLEADCQIRYFAVNNPKPQSITGTACRLVFNYAKFFWQLIAFNYQLVHVNPSLYPRSFYRDAVFIIISKLLKRKVLVTFHGWLEDYEEQIRKSTVKSFLFKVSYAKADKYIVLGEIFKRKLIEMGVPHTTDFFIETTVADSKFLAELDLEKKLHSYTNNVIFLFLAEITKLKGVFIALDAYKEFSKRHPERRSSLIVAGDGSELPSVKKYVSEEGVQHVIFTGHVSEHDKKEVLLQSHILLHPSYTEGLPNTILEGMLFGMPIVSRLTGAIPDVVQQGINGFLSESYNASIFAEFMELLALNPEVYKKIALTNHKTALCKYTTEKVRNRMLKIYSAFK